MGVLPWHNLEGLACQHMGGMLRFRVPPSKRQADGPLRRDPPADLSPDSLHSEYKDSSLHAPETIGRGAALLKLKKVELLGFKSFCEKTTITFSGTGLTCIVGPNGCGKSNIVDAISWVLGEQSHKSLRAERMADCIFNGTQKRPPMGLSEVSLTLVDPELAEAAEKVMEKAEAELQPQAAEELTAESAEAAEESASAEDANTVVEASTGARSSKKPRA